jgi:RHS repeat-associated protein
LRCKQSRKNSC